MNTPFALVTSTLLVAGACAGECDLAGDVPALPDLGNDTYKTLDGGLYGGGVNARPPDHEAAGVDIAQAIEPLDVDGAPNPDGVIGLMSIGFSNMTHIWRVGASGEPESAEWTFTAKALELQGQGQVNPKLRIVDGANSGITADEWAQPPVPNQFPWIIPMMRLQNEGMTRFQVQAVAVYTTTPFPIECIANDGNSLGEAGVLAGLYAQIARNLKSLFPNTRLVYFVSREYAGYALTDLHPEPFAYEMAFGVRETLRAQIDGTGTYGDLNFDPRAGSAPAPWISWGPYLWANGPTPNGQGLFWLPEDFRDDDLTHPSGLGVSKSSDVFIDFFANDSTTRPWFLSPGALCPADLNDSGAVGFDDLLILLAEWGPCPPPVPCSADIDDDDNVGLSDLLSVLASWGPCQES